MMIRLKSPHIVYMNYHISSRWCEVYIKRERGNYLLTLYIRYPLRPCLLYTSRVSVPMWGTFLSEPLSIVVLVGRYPANKLMERIPIDNRNSLIVKPCGFNILSDINLSFERLSPSYRQVGYVLLTRAPVAIFSLQAN